MGEDFKVEREFSQRCVISMLPYNVLFDITVRGVNKKAKRKGEKLMHGNNDGRRWDSSCMVMVKKRQTENIVNISERKGTKRSGEIAWSGGQNGSR